MNKPTLKEVKLLKKLFFRSILYQMNSEKGYKFIVWIYDEKESFLSVTVTSKDNYGCEDIDVPVRYHTGIDDGKTFLNMLRVGLASEEAKRRIRDLFPGHEKFITWAYYN